MGATVKVGGEMESVAAGGIVVDAKAVRTGNDDSQTLDKELNNIHERTTVLSEAEYKALVESNTVKDNVIYFTYKP